MRLAFPDCNPEIAALFDEEMRALLPELEVRIAEPGDAAGLVAAARGCTGLMLVRTKVDAGALAALPDLRVISYLSTGVGSWVDLRAAAARGVAVQSVLGYGDRSVAEHALALIFSALRGVAAMDRGMRAGMWPTHYGREIAGKQLGIVGLGGVGRALAAMGEALGCQVVGWNRSALAKPPCRLLPLDELLATSDIVSLHLGLDETSRGIIDRRRIALLKAGAILVNTARGGLIDEAALIERLQIGDVHAGLDVFAQEPLAPGHRLTKLENVTLSAHAAWFTLEAGRRLLRAGLLSLRDALR
jgi:D-3-phosphoglycerate dehydrogenase / 2-oxoglutarate reductase